MFLIRFPIPMGNTVTQLPKPRPLLPCAHSQTRRFFPPSSLFPDFQSRKTVVHLSRGVDTAWGSLPLTEPELRPDLMPKHVAVCMDGNRRWAKMRGLPVTAGYEAGIESMMRIIDLSCSWGIKVLTLFLFSCDNWKRSKVEVELLMGIYESAMNTLIETSNRKGIKISVIGDTSKLATSLQRMMSTAEEKTKQNCGMQLTIAISYSGQYDVVQACKAISKKVKDGVVHVEEINERMIEQELETKCCREFPNPDLMIRTSGELRMSNFMLWQVAFTELVFDPHLWPDFGKDQFAEALVAFQQRQRRFGGPQA